MIDKQQLQAMGEHQAEQSMCMAKQIEDLQARLQECANGAAKMQEQRDAAYVMAGKSGLERDKFAQQLKAANRQIAAMAELLRGASPFLDYVQSGACHISNDDVSEAIELSDRIAAALAGELPGHVAGAGKMVEPLTWRNTGHPNGLKRFLTQKQYEAQTPGVQQWFEPIVLNAPEGWQIVPVEPTPEMLDAAEQVVAATGGFPEIWQYMLESAPRLEPTK